MTAIEALPGALHHLADGFGCEPIDVHGNHHPCAQVLEPKLLHDEAVVEELLPLAVHQEHHTPLASAAFQIAAERRRAFVEDEFLALIQVER
ncbi:MAG TPA: hypothetical protein DD732_09500 [Rhizobiales bacterium]|nr:hypothetical protein [Hyphomicrobiales bacterium]